MQEQWTRWEPVEGLVNNYDILSCCDDYETGFTLVLCEANNRKKRLHIVWEYSVACYASANESYVFAMLNDIAGRHGKDFFRNWTFFKVKNSNYLQRISISSDKVSDDLGLIHFAIVSEESMLDIIDRFEPTIEFVNLP